MMKRIVIAALALASLVPAFGQEKGAITPDMLSRISAKYEGTASDKAIKNALAGTSIATLAINSENAAMIDTHFTDQVKSKGITDQKSSGRCWLFTGLNVLRAKSMEEFELPEFQFSQNYCFFYDQLEKANLFLQGVIDTRKMPMDERKVDHLFANPVSDGGTFTGVVDLVNKYGVVPSEAMPETFCSNNTSQMAMLLGRKLREDGLRLRGAAADGANEKTLAAMKEEQLAEIYRVLCLCLGVPPQEFTWTRCDKDGKIVAMEKHTPISFRDKYAANELFDGYVMLMNDPSREYGKIYDIDYDRHVYEGHNWLYVNLPIEDIKKMAIASIKAGDAMYFSCDVGKFLDRTKGTLDLANFDYSSLLGIDFTMDKRERIITHASGSSHAMTLVAVNVLEDGSTDKWMVENSWGMTGYKGHLIMTDEWFDEYMFRLVVKTKYVPSDILGMFRQKPVLLPAWDPMFMPEE
ncbi:MAG: C1 family peptidase [Bacteroidales bacterium]|nr:C1 family peptidase [Bacteroidales bacterium]